MKALIHPVVGTKQYVGNLAPLTQPPVFTYGIM